MFATAITGVRGRLISRGNALATRWVLSHSGIKGNAVANEWARSAEKIGDSVAGDYLREIAFAQMTKMATGVKSAGVGRRIVDRVDRRRRRKPPRGGQKLRKELGHERKALVGRYF